ncbi:hypothetical protein POM88_001032 [Heracleum sosnowskyi]|uniref:Uncharacterized protein n=1 Tax=Heracleum sosnowskyi TaxID=360622 RepID=A0AAD8JFC5_9APIA|nr:hypothetical protein POM88_001032 [Heracleum sosnowskyi]
MFRHGLSVMSECPRVWKPKLKCPRNIDVKDSAEGCVVALNTRHYMDKRESGKESSVEYTRESLITLSHCLPDSPKLSAKKLSSGHLFNDINGDKAETHRSKLISLSNKQSLDTKARLVSPGA